VQPKEKNWNLIYKFILIAKEASSSQERCVCGLCIIAELMDEDNEENVRVTIGEVNLIYRAGVNIGFGAFALVGLK